MHTYQPIHFEHKHCIQNHFLQSNHAPIHQNNELKQKNMLSILLENYMILFHPLCIHVTKKLNNFMIIAILSITSKHSSPHGMIFPIKWQLLEKKLNLLNTLAFCIHVNKVQLQQTRWIQIRYLQHTHEPFPPFGSNPMMNTPWEHFLKWTE